MPLVQIQVVQVFIAALISRFIKFKPFRDKLDRLEDAIELSFLEHNLLQTLGKVVKAEARVGVKTWLLKIYFPKITHCRNMH